LIGDQGAPERPRVVLDTSALFSQHRHWLWLLARLGYFDAVWSTFIVGELVRIRVEHSIQRGVSRSVYRQRINDLVHLLSDVLEVADYRRAEATGWLRDPDDEPILATAIAASAGSVVSLNTRDFPVGAEAAGIRFVTPQAFLTELADLHPPGEVGERAHGSGRLLP